MTKRPASVDALFAGTYPKPSSLLDDLAPIFPLIQDMAQTPQDPEWHGEGNVRIHTEWVISEIINLIQSEEFGAVSVDERVALVLAAALHDIGKTLTTREQEIDGKVRIVSPHHAGRGRSYVAMRMPELHLDTALERMIIGLVGHHHDPKKLVLRNAEDRHYRRLTRCVAPKWILLLETADMRGRECADDTAAEEWLAMFQMVCEERAVYNCQDPYQAWKDEIADALHDCSPSALAYVQDEAIRQYESGLIQSPPEAIARTYPYRDHFSKVVITCGASGSGKSHWVQEHCPDSQRISLDEIREELCGRRDDQSKNGQVMQLAKERLRECLRAKSSVVWEATNLREDGRATLMQLAYDYHATPRLVMANTTPTVLESRNRKRKHAIPSSVLHQQWDRLQWPHVYEAHTLEVIGRTGSHTAF